MSITGSTMKEVEIKQVSEKMGKLKHAIDSMGEEIKDLESRLAGVLREKSSTPPLVPEPNEPLVPLALELDMLAERTGEIYRNAASILARLEL